MGFFFASFTNGIILIEIVITMFWSVNNIVEDRDLQRQRERERVHENEIFYTLH